MLFLQRVVWSVSTCDRHEEGNKANCHMYGWPAGGWQVNRSNYAKFLIYIMDP